MDSPWTAIYRDRAVTHVSVWAETSGTRKEPSLGRISRKIAALGPYAAAAAVGVTMAASPAQAALYGGHCGSGYNLVNLIDLPNQRGTVYLTYKSTGKNCVVTIRGNRRTRTSTYAKDSGDSTTYADPVCPSAACSCVDWCGKLRR